MANDRPRAHLSGIRSNDIKSALVPGQMQRVVSRIAKKLAANDDGWGQADILHDDCGNNQHQNQDNHPHKDLS